MILAHLCVFTFKIFKNFFADVFQACKNAHMTKVTNTIQMGIKKMQNFRRILNLFK